MFPRSGKDIMITHLADTW